MNKIKTNKWAITGIIYSLQTLIISCKLTITFYIIIHVLQTIQFIKVSINKTKITIPVHVFCNKVREFNFESLVVQVTMAITWQLHLYHY